VAVDRSRNGAGQSSKSKGDYEELASARPR
jgi:hypothetical protein